jgi:lysophospholipase L1-like esterase
MESPPRGSTITSQVIIRWSRISEAGRRAVDVVCLGDSLTGYNDSVFSPDGYWPYRTYPDFFQELCVPLGLRVANGGIEVAVSDNGPQQVRDYLALFPNARHFVFGMGFNDLQIRPWPKAEATSKRIIANLGKMVQLVRDGGKQAILFNVPNVNEAEFPPLVAKVLRAQRDYHNAMLRGFCEQNRVPLADICSRLRDEHIGDELHPNEAGAKIIAEEVLKVLAPTHKARQELPE